MILGKPIFQIFGIKLNWNLNAYLFIYHLCGTKVKIEKKSEPLLNNGFILANHRSWFDFGFDPFISDASVVGRKEAFWAVTLAYVLGLFDNKMIVFDRVKTNRKELFKKITQNMKDPRTKRI